MEDGRPLAPAYITRLFQAIRCQDEPLPELTFHGLRHSAASLMLAGGAGSAMRRFPSQQTCMRTWLLPSGSVPWTVPPR
jgi:integrase